MVPHFVNISAYIAVLCCCLFSFPGHVVCLIPNEVSVNCDRLSDTISRLMERVFGMQYSSMVTARDRTLSTLYSSDDHLSIVLYPQLAFPLGASSAIAANWRQCTKTSCPILNVPVVRYCWSPVLKSCQAMNSPSENAVLINSIRSGVEVGYVVVSSLSAIRMKVGQSCQLLLFMASSPELPHWAGKSLSLSWSAHYKCGWATVGNCSIPCHVGNQNGEILRLKCVHIAQFAILIADWSLW